MSIIVNYYTEESDLLKVVDSIPEEALQLALNRTGNGWNVSYIIPEDNDAES